MMGKYVYKVRHLEEEFRCRTFASEFCKMPVPKVSQGRLFSM